MLLLEMLVFHTMPPMWCKSCGTFKPYEMFHDKLDHRKKEYTGKEYECIDCHRARCRERDRIRKISALGSTDRASDF